MNRNKLTGRQTLVVAFVVVLSATACALADDFSLPPWQRGETAGTTFQQWSFGTDGKENIQPDLPFSNPGIPLARVVSSESWIDVDGLRQGIWPLLGQIDIYIPNYPQIQPEKNIWLQLTWKPAEPELDPFLPSQPFISIVTDPPSFEPMTILRQDEPTADGWVHTLFDITISPNPVNEWVVIKGDIFVDQVVVDTWCVPEPGSLSLLGLAAWLGLRRRRRV